MCTYNILNTTPHCYLSREGVRIIKPEDIRLRRNTELAEHRNRLNAKITNDIMKGNMHGTRN